MEDFSQLFSGTFSSEFFSRLILDGIVIYIIARQIYFRTRENRDYLFTLFFFNIMIFFVCYLMNSVKLSIGFAFGIFAIFSILRYRTQTVPIKEMTYMFISIGVAIINALSGHQISMIELVLTNFSIIACTFLLEKTWIRNELKKNIIYEKIEMVKPENHELLLEDLRRRTGLNIQRLEIGRIDFLRDIANITVYYYEQESQKKKKQ